MSPARRRFLLALFCFLTAGILTFLGYNVMQDRSGSILYYQPSADDPRQSVELERAGETWFLVDRTQPFRQEEGRRLLNPWKLSSDQLRSISRERWDLDNPWISFQHLYVSYYDKFYRSRFDRTLSRTDGVIKKAYEQWKREVST